MINEAKLISAEIHDNTTVIPEYLDKVYWWAYIHPWAIKFFDRQWMVNLILWGNFPRLRDLALDTIGKKISGQTLQVACVYGDFTPHLAKRLTTGAKLDVVDVLPMQLDNLRQKLGQHEQIRLFQSNSAMLTFAENASYDHVVLFFLLHEQPEATRRATLQEAYRVVKPAGKIVIMDYHKPSAWHPLRYLMVPLLRWLEPYALDLWQHELTTWLPASVSNQNLVKTTRFGGLYQHVVIQVH